MFTVSARRYGEKSEGENKTRRKGKKKKVSSPWNETEEKLLSKVEEEGI